MTTLLARWHWSPTMYVYSLDGRRRLNKAVAPRSGANSSPRRSVYLSPPCCGVQRRCACLAVDRWRIPCPTIHKIHTGRFRVQFSTRIRFSTRRCRNIDSFPAVGSRHEIPLLRPRVLEWWRSSIASARFWVRRRRSKRLASQPRGEQQSIRDQRLQRRPTAPAWDAAVAARLAAAAAAAQASVVAGFIALE